MRAAQHAADENARGEKRVSAKEMRNLISSGATVWQYTEVNGGFELEVELNGKRFLTEGGEHDLGRLLSGQTRTGQ